ncbi:patatin-like phospholipase family protein [Nonomuraea guangzhouensis]|uniref:Patatin-like phospholipase family protein n=1 Tax=Nonomuraea guangzhouensis TaxID=1291555 RepID=A0ABW4GUW8_9ACTN|nr:patatin-like phospholipase family protein [Nonomuraea guangzhouensis]
MSTAPAIGLALSGGGFRATAFGLGCLRALHDSRLLPQVRVVSGISGGSLLAAMWAYGPRDFADFDDNVTALLRRGMQAELIRSALLPSRVLKGVVSRVRSMPGLPRRRLRTFTRTEALVHVLATRFFGSRTVEQITVPNLTSVISATDLITTNAVRFGSAGSSCSAYGRIVQAVPVADAVAASAAFPALLPALARTYDFADARMGTRTEAVLMTDGGVYDNLGLSPLLPGRSRAFTSHVYDLDYIFAIDAGRGRTTKQAAPFLLGRLVRSFDIAYNRTQDGSRALLNTAVERGPLRGFVHAYLAMRDHKLPVPIADYVPRAAVVDYPTDFRAVSAENFRLLTVRGEQLTRVLLAHYCPELLAGP